MVQAGPKWSHAVPFITRGKQRTACCRKRKGSDHCSDTAGFADGGRRYKPSDAAQEAGKGQRQILPRASRGERSPDYIHLHFRPVKLTWDFCLRCCKRINCVLLSHQDRGKFRAGLGS